MSKDTKASGVTTELPAVYFNRMTVQADKDIVRITFFEMDGDLIIPRAAVVSDRSRGTIIRYEKEPPGPISSSSTPWFCLAVINMPESERV